MFISVGALKIIIVDTSNFYERERERKSRPKLHASNMINLVKLVLLIQKPIYYMKRNEYSCYSRGKDESLV